MLIDLQVSTDRLLALVRNALRPQALCITQPFPLGFFLSHIEIPTASGFLDGSPLPAPGGFMRRAPDVSQLEFAVLKDGSETLETVAVNHPQFVVPIQLHLTSYSRLAAGEPPVHNINTIVGLILTVFGEIDRDKDPLIPRVRVSVTDVDLMAWDDQLADADKQVLRDQLAKAGKVKLPITLGPLASMLGDPPPPFRNIAVGIDVPSGSSDQAMRLGVRWELGDAAGSAASWSTYLNAPLAGGPAQAQGDWSVVVPDPLITTLAADSATTFLAKEEAKPEDEKKISVLKWPTSTWQYWLTTVRTEFDINIVKPGECRNNIGVTVTLHGHLQPASDGHLEISTDVVWDAYDSDVLACALLSPLSDPTSTFTNAIVGGIMAESYDPNLKQYGAGDVPGFKCAWQGDDKIVCSRPVPSPLPGVPVTLTSVVGQPGAAVLSGTMSITEFPAAGITLEAIGGPFEQQFRDICEDFVRVTVLNVASYNGSHCVEPEVLEDELQQFAPYLKEYGHPTDLGYKLLRVVIPETGLLPEYLADPYDCQVRVRTSRGAAHVTSPPPEEFEELPSGVEAASLFAMRDAQCNTYTGWGSIDQIEVFGQRLWTDPAPDDAVVEHGWQFMVTGLPAGRSFAVLDASQRPVGFATAGLSALGYLDVTLPPDLGTHTTLTGWPPDGPGAMRIFDRGPETRDPIAISLEQMLLVRSALVSLDGACRSAGLAGHQGRDVAWCVTGNGLRVYDITGDTQVPIASFDHPGLTGAHALDPRRFLVWGSAGLALLEEPTDRGPSYGRTWITREPVLSVARAGPRTYVLMPDRIEILDRSLNVAAHLDSTGGWALAATANRLTVAHDGGVTAYTTSDLSRAAAVSALEVPNVTALDTARIPHHPDAVVVTDGRGRVQIVDMASARVPVVLLTLEHERYFTAAARTRTAMIRRGSDHESLEVFHVADRRQLTREQLDAERAQD